MIDERVVRLSPAREHARERARAAGTCDRESRNLSQRVGDRRQLTIVQLGAGDDRNGRRGLRERDLHLRGGHDKGFRHRRHREVERADVAGRGRGLEDNRIGAEAFQRDTQFVSSRVGRRQREFPTRVRRRGAHGNARRRRAAPARRRPGVRSGSTTRPFTGPADASAAQRIVGRVKREMKWDRYRTGLLLGVFTRRCLLAEAEKDEPGVKYPGLRIVRIIPAFPCSAHSGCRSGRLRGMLLPAYSGGTAWDSHPLRVTAGQSR